MPPADSPRSASRFLRLKREWLIGIQTFSATFCEKVGPCHGQPLSRFVPLILRHKQEYAFFSAPQREKIRIAQENMRRVGIVGSCLKIVFPPVPDHQISMGLEG